MPSLVWRRCQHQQQHQRHNSNSLNIIPPIINSATAKKLTMTTTSTTTAAIPSLVGASAAPSLAEMWSMDSPLTAGRARRTLSGTTSRFGRVLCVCRASARRGRSSVHGGPWTPPASLSPPKQLSASSSPPVPVLAAPLTTPQPSPRRPPAFSTPATAAPGPTRPRPLPVETVATPAAQTPKTPIRPCPAAALTKSRRREAVLAAAATPTWPRGARYRPWAMQRAQ